MDRNDTTAIVSFNTVFAAVNHSIHTVSTSNGFTYRQRGSAFVSTSSIVRISNGNTHSNSIPSNSIFRNSNVCRDGHGKTAIVSCDIVVSGAVVTPLQYGGYSIALAGVVAYTRYKTAKSAAAPTAASKSADEVKVAPKDVRAATEEEAAPLAFEDGREGER